MDIDLTQLAQLIHIAEQADIDELEVREGQTTIRITCRHPAQACHAAIDPHAQPVPHQASPIATTKLPQAMTASALSKPANQGNNPTETKSDNSQARHINSPMVGTFYRKSSPDVPAFVEVGQSVAAGDTLCIVEAMKIMHEVKAEQACVIEQILVPDGDMVEYDQPIFIIA